MSEKILSFAKKRDEKIAEKKRKFERIVFDHFLGCYPVVDDEGTLFEASLVDISDDGCMFQIPITQGFKGHHRFKIGQEVPLRFYFMKSSFLPIVLDVRHITEFTNSRGDRFFRFGGKFAEETKSLETLRKLIDFMGDYAVTSVEDRGHRKLVFY
jgi:hypothetical protein